MRKVLLSAAIAAAAAAPLAQPASAVCESVSAGKNAATVGYCDEYTDHWSWCAGVGVTGVAGVGACRPTDGAGVFVGCWTFQGLHCN